MSCCRDMTFQDPGPLDTHTATIDWAPSTATPTRPRPRPDPRWRHGDRDATPTRLTGPRPSDLCVTDRSHDGARRATADNSTSASRCRSGRSARSTSDTGSEGTPGDPGSRLDRHERRRVVHRRSWTGATASPVETVRVAQSVVGCTSISPYPPVVCATASRWQLPRTSTPTTAATPSRSGVRRRQSLNDVEDRARSRS